MHTTLWSNDKRLNTVQYQRNHFHLACIWLYQVTTHTKFNKRKYKYCTYCSLKKIIIQNLCDQILLQPFIQNCKSSLVKIPIIFNSKRQDFHLLRILSEEEFTQLRTQQKTAYSYFFSKEDTKQWSKKLRFSSLSGPSSLLPTRTRDFRTLRSNIYCIFVKKKKFA